MLEHELGQILDRTLSLNRDELLLLDWVISCPVGQGPVSLQWYMEWRLVRERIWYALHLADNVERRNKPRTEKIDVAVLAYPIEIEMDEAQQLLALAPPSFRWGAGPDCGLSLKLTLTRYIQGLSTWEPDREEGQHAGEPDKNVADYETYPGG